MVERALGKDHQNVALTLLVIGDACASSGDYQDARSYYERALLIRMKHFTDSSLELVECKKRIHECRIKKEGVGEFVIFDFGFLIFPAVVGRGLLTQRPPRTQRNIGKWRLE